MLTVRVIFGEDLCQEHFETGKEPPKNEISTYEFSTPEEVKAFKKGLNEAFEWHNFEILE